MKSAAYLEYVFLSFLETFCADQMRWLRAASVFLNRVGKIARVDFLKVIFFLLSLPLFKFSNLFFELAHALGQRRLGLLCGEIVSCSSMTAALR